IGNVPTSIDLIECCLLFSKAFFVQQQMFRLTTFSQGVNMRMLDKNEVVFGSYRSIVSAISCFLSNSIFQKCFLSFPGFLIINYTPILKKNFFILHHI